VALRERGGSIRGVVEVVVRGDVGLEPSRSLCARVEEANKQQKEKGRTPSLSGGGLVLG
jgi:hypothetical protein